MKTRRKTSVTPHLRRVRTKRGVKIKPIKRYRSTRMVGRRPIVIDSVSRDVFDSLAKRDSEVGGEVDFDDGSMSQMSVVVGGEGFVDLIEGESEVEYHTHPVGNVYRSTPSVDDVKGFMNASDKRAQIVFYDDGCFVIEKKSGCLLSDSEIEDIDGVAVGKSKGVASLLQKNFLSGLNDSGKVKAFVSKKGAPISLSVKENKKDLVVVDKRSRKARTVGSVSPDEVVWEYVDKPIEDENVVSDGISELRKQRDLLKTGLVDLDKASEADNLKREIDLLEKKREAFFKRKLAEEQKEFERLLSAGGDDWDFDDPW